MSEQPLPDRAAVTQDLIAVLRVFSVEIDVFVDVFARAHGLGRNEMNAIMWIAEGSHDEHPQTAGELAIRLGLGAPATSALLDRLESAGHVTRTRDLPDRRKVGVRMQEQALQLAMEFFGPLGARLAEAVSDLATKDLATTTRVVDRLIAAVVDARQAAATTPPTTPPSQPPS